MIKRTEPTLAQMKDLPERAIGAVEGIIRDLQDRHGLQNAWDDIDEDIQGEIMVAWMGIIVRALSA